MENKNKIQQRQITITEFLGGVYEIDAVAWKLELDEKEIEEAFSAWRRGDLKENSHFDNRTPRMLKELDGGE